MSESNPTESRESRPRQIIGGTTIARLARMFAYWFKLLVQPAVAILFVVGLAWLFGYAQRHYNWFNDAATTANNEQAEEDALYACSMLCVFVKAPGRCPVCGMELQKIDVPGDPKDIFGVTINPTARRLANIRTVAALNLPTSREIEVLGRIAYDETTESTISAYIDGRVEELFIDFTGARVKQGEPLAVIYSPDLYADQVGLLSARQNLDSSRQASERVQSSNQRMYESARRRLAEFGLPEQQIDAIEKRGEPDSRIRIVSPISGTCVEKRVDKGDYVKTGMPLMKLADLSNVWLQLEMFPEDTANLKIGQSVTVSIQSLVGQTFEGEVSFIDPMVNSQTNTVNVRVEIPNQAGLIKIGDYGRARINTSQVMAQDLVVVPREAVLINGADSVAYVETEPGRFEFRKVEIAEIMGDQISLSSGIKAGEQVAASGVFMLDSTFNIQGKVSLIDPNRAEVKNLAQLANGEAEAREIEEAFSSLSPEDRHLAEHQVICPVTEVKLGTLGMGAPIRVSLEQGDIMICCEGCRSKLLEEPQKYLSILQQYHSDVPSPEEQAEIDESFAALSDEDRQLAVNQVICPVTDVRLGTMGMGTPIRVDVNGTPVMICCEGCRKQLLQKPSAYLARLEEYHSGQRKNAEAKPVDDPTESMPQMELPQMELPQMELPQMELPQMELPKMELPDKESPQ